MPRDVRAEYSVDNTASTIFGHSLGGGLAAYFMTQYDPAKGENNPFGNFVIVDNGYLDYYNRHYDDFATAMRNNGGAAYSTLNILRIWGGTVNPEGANHGDPQAIGLDAAVALTLGTWQQA